MEFVTGRVIREHIEHVVADNEGIIEDNNIYFVRVEGSPDSQATRKGQSHSL